MFIKFMPLRYFLIFILCIIFPVILYAAAAIFACVVGPVALLGFLLLFIPYHICSSLKKFNLGDVQFIIGVFFIFFAIPFCQALACAGLLGLASLIACIVTILLVLYYPFMFVLIIIMLFRHCNIFPKTKHTLTLEQQ